MAIAAHFDEILKPSGAPRDPRRKLLLEARGTLGPDNEANVLIHNVSESGLLMESQAELKIGEKIDIEMPHAGVTRAKIIWNSGNLYGCQFDVPVSSATLSAAQLRGTVDGQEGIHTPRRSLPDESFGVRLHRLRTDRGFTLSQLAAQLGVSKPTVWAWEQGKARPIDSRIEGLAQALGVSSSELLPGRETPAVRELVAKTREQIAVAFGLSPDKIRIVIDL